MGNLSSHPHSPKVFLSFSSLNLILGTFVLLLGRGWERADRQNRGAWQCSFPGSEMLGEQNLMAKLHCAW